MRVFVTGATGFIGSALVPELIGAGHQVLGLTRSEAGADSLARAGAQVHRGDLEDLESLRSGAAQSDAVIHLAFNHDFSKFLENCATDRRVIEALGTVLAGSDRLLIVTSGTGMANPASGVPATEDVTNVGANVNPRAASEQTVAAAAAQGSRVIIVRLPQVHDTVKQGLVSYAIRLAREKGVVAYVGDGKNRWPAAHVLDTTRRRRRRRSLIASSAGPIRMLTFRLRSQLKCPPLSKPGNSPATGSPPGIPTISTASSPTTLRTSFFLRPPQLNSSRSSQAPSTGSTVSATTSSAVSTPSPISALTSSTSSSESPASSCSSTTSVALKPPSSWNSIPTAE